MIIRHITTLVSPSGGCAKTPAFHSEPFTETVNDLTKDPPRFPHRKNGSREGGGHETVSLIRGLISSSSSSYHSAMRDAVRFTKSYTWKRWLARSSCVPALLCWGKSFVFKASSTKMSLWVVWLLNSSICTKISNFSPIHSPRESFLTNLPSRIDFSNTFESHPSGYKTRSFFQWNCVIYVFEFLFYFILFYFT